jgi:hypothetical protein
MKLDFRADGLTILSALSPALFHQILQVTTLKVLSLLRVPPSSNLATYHDWYSQCETYRSYALCAQSRHFPTSMWLDTSLFSILELNLAPLFPYSKLSLWDEGLGTSAFRLVRPGFDDGYPPSRKSWGPGGNLISVTIPLIGFTKYESQGFLLGSHLIDLPSYIPDNTIFCTEEKRLLDWETYELTRLSTTPGDIIVFHWDTIHTEQILGLNTTRLALELRYIIDN